MSPADLLLTLAEIAIAFVGFSAIVIVFRRFATGSATPFQNLQVSAIIQIGLLALLLCLFPLLLQLFPISDSAAWRSSSLLFALAIALQMTLYARVRARMAVPPEVNPRGYAVRMSASALVGVLQVLNALLFPASLHAAVYCAGVVWLLAMVAWVFIAMWSRWGAPDADKT